MSTYRHSIRDLWDWTRPLAEHPLPPLGTGPLLAEPRRPSHVSGCGCVECWNAGLRYGEYLKQKKLEDL